MPTRRSLIAQGSLAIAIVAGVALFLLVNMAGAKFYVQWDWTGSGLFTLTTKSEEIVAGLDRKVRIVSFLTDQGLGFGDVAEQIQRILTLYQGKNPARIQLETIDPNRDPRRASALLAEFGIDPLRDTIDVIVVQSGERKKMVRLLDMVQFDEGGSSPQPMIRSLNAEAALTGAILAVTRPRQPSVVLAAGHGERSVQSSDNTGLSQLYEALGRLDLQLRTWDALGSREVPAGTDLVIVAGPTTAWLPVEREALAAFLRRGGRALVLLDPIIQRGGAASFGPTGLEPLLAEWGLSADQNVVIDPGGAVPMYGPETFIAKTLGLHPVVRGLGGQPVLLPFARSISPLNPAPTGIEIHALAETSPSAWGETDISKPEAAKDGADKGGPLAVALAAAPRTGSALKGRMVVIGCSSLADNAALDQVANRSLTLNSIAWLLEEDRALGIPSKDRALTKLVLDNNQIISLFVLLIVLLPLATIGAGIGVWLKRRGR